MAAKAGASKIFVWGLLALLFVGIAGFGATNFSGTIRDVAAVGDKDISVDAYARALQSEISAIEGQSGQSITFQQAQAIGLDQRALSQLITGAALDHEAGSLGLSVGDAQLLEQIQAIQAFQGPDGQFDREAYRFGLENAGLNEAEFEDQLRDESARTLLQGAVLAGTALPDSYINTLLSFAMEQRSFTWAVVENNALSTGVPVPSEADLKTFYDDNIARYTSPETRQITYAWVNPAMIVDSVDVDETAMRNIYDERSGEYNKPERRLAERLVFPDDAAANNALTRIQSGASTFEDEAQVRGLEIADTDLGDVTSDDLGAAADVVFAAQAGDVVGPAQSDFGPALFRVNGVLPASTVSFDDIKDALRTELAQDRARRVIETQLESLQDLLAGGATLEDLDAETDLELGQIAWTSNLNEGIAAYDGFRRAAAAVTADDFPEITDLQDGGVFALRLDGISAPAPIPFEDTRDQVETDWAADSITRALTDLTEGYAAQLEEGRTFAALGLTNATIETGVLRRGFIEALPVSVVSSVFDMTEGSAIAIADAGRAVLVQLNQITQADPDAEDAAQLGDALRDQAASDVAQDLFSALAADIQARAGISIDQQALNAVHTNFQ